MATTISEATPGTADEPEATPEPAGEPETGDVGDTVVEPESSTVEPQEPTGDPVPGTEPEPAPEPAPGDGAEPPLALGMSERDFEQAARKLDRGVERYRAVVQEFIETTGQSLIENKADLAHVPGYIFHPDVRPLDDEQAAFARASLGMPIEPAFPADPMSHACSLCDGWGQVKTGSKVAGKVVVRCPDCQGAGFTSSRPYAAPVPASLRVAGDEPASVLTPEEESGEDAWGTPRNHPDWGKAPQYRSPTWTAELEAYKRGEPAPVV